MGKSKFMKFLVNIITISRIVFSVFLMLLIDKVSNIFLLIVIIIIFLTDFFDVFLTRKFNVQTLFRSMIDTIADKILSIVLIIPLLSYINALYFVVLREGVIAIINVRARIRGKLTKSSMLGKIKTWLLAITIILFYLYLFNYITSTLPVFMMVLTSAIQVIVIIYYIVYLKKQEDNAKININKSNLKGRWKR